MFQFLQYTTPTLYLFLIVHLLVSSNSLSSSVEQFLAAQFSRYKLIRPIYEAFPGNSDLVPNFIGPNVSNVSSWTAVLVGFQECVFVNGPSVLRVSDPTKHVLLGHDKASNVMFSWSIIHGKKKKELVELYK